jgi:aryl-alcohol dehydrogenase-like predicted oxidoreductase
MQQTAINSLRLPLSRAILGTMTFGDTCPPGKSLEILEVALDAGITMIDTANGYSGGRSEEIIAPFYAKHSEKMMIATKVGIPHKDAGQAHPLSKEGINRCVEASLSRLKVEHIDVLYLHAPDRLTPISETLEVIAQLIQQGKITTYATSNFSSWQLSELSHSASALGLERPVLAQQMYSLIARKIEDEFIEYAHTSGTKLISYNPLAGGLLASRYTIASNPDQGRFGDSALAQMYKSRYWNKETFDVLTLLTQIASKNSMTLTELALRWLISKSGVTSILLGASKVENLQESCQYITRDGLSETIVQECETVSAPLKGVSPKYNR